MTGFFINNQWREGHGPQLTSLTPDERQMLWQHNTATHDQVADAVSAAQTAFLSWKNTPFDDRKAIVLAFAEQLTQRAADFANAIQLETGKPLWEAQGEVTAMINKVAISITAYQDRTGEWQKDHLQLAHRPHGVMAVFGPYNFPGHLPNGHIVPALLAGNTGVFKPSESTPWVAQLTLEAWQAAGIPAGVINGVQGGREVGEALVNADVQGVLFTGSSATGKAIHRALAGRPEVLLALEMGGNNPLIVGNAFDPTVAGNIILHSAFLSAGQRCTCSRRLILVDNEHTQNTLKALEHTLISMAKRIRLNHPDQASEAFMGPVIHSHAAQSVLNRQDALLSGGARALMSSTALPEGAVYLTPGILDVTDCNTVEDEETFGPLLQIHRVASFEDALDLANHTRFGLAAGLISDDADEQAQFKQQIRAGVISINAPTAGASSALPFGGTGDSGNHRPSALYAADYCAWPQATTHQTPTSTQAASLNIQAIRGLEATSSTPSTDTPASKNTSGDA